MSESKASLVKKVEALELIAKAARDLLDDLYDFKKENHLIDVEVMHSETELKKLIKDYFD